ncbi:TetR/AcrR family transcriptional regulator [Chitinimonas sp.]|uniref:TetR/AcrR family transcriptional regulator n=1 Tax=Chitinimonas sp. TaxID=1934313 RepID=UPI0035AF03C5
MTQSTPKAMERNEPLDATAARRKAMAAFKTVAERKPAAEVNYGDIAAEAGLPWQTVKRLLGPRENLPALLDGDVPEPIDTRDRILASAARVFSRKSYLGASLDEVAADAGLTKGAVYWHFKSKNDLFFALLDSRFQQEFDEHLPQAMAQDAQYSDPKEGLKALLASVLERVRQDPDWPRLLLEFMSQARDPEVNSRLAAAYQASYGMSAELIRRQHESRGQQPPADPALLAMLWSALMDGLIIAWLVNPQKIDLEQLLPQIIDLLWQGLAPRQAADSSQ